MAAKQREPVPNADRMIWFIHTQLLRKKMTKSKLSQRSGVDRSTLLHWWRGETEPTLLKVQSVLGVLGFVLKPIEIGKVKNYGKVQAKKTNRR